jgi:mannose-6-phosphate isomerase-like protein (cupin superfamily)
MDDYTVTDQRGLQILPETQEFEGERHGTSVSFILVDMPPGSGVRLHRHTYSEIFIVQQGHATYTVGSSTLEVEAPRTLVVAAGVPHAFVNTGHVRLEQVDIHLSPRFVTEWLEPDGLSYR